MISDIARVHSVPPKPPATAASCFPSTGGGLHRFPGPRARPPGRGARPGSWEGGIVWVPAAAFFSVRAFIVIIFCKSQHRVMSIIYFIFLSLSLKLAIAYTFRCLLYHGEHTTTSPLRVDIVLNPCVFLNPGHLPIPSISSLKETTMIFSDT